jgi:hypothetical protein
MPSSSGRRSGSEQRGSNPVIAVYQGFVFTQYAPCYLLRGLALQPPAFVRQVDFD